MVFAQTQNCWKCGVVAPGPRMTFGKSLDGTSPYAQRLPHPRLHHADVLDGLLRSPSNRDVKVLRPLLLIGRNVPSRRHRIPFCADSSSAADRWHRIVAPEGSFLAGGKVRLHLPSIRTGQRARKPQSSADSLAGAIDGSSASVSARRESSQPGRSAGTESTSSPVYGWCGGAARTLR